MGKSELGVSSPRGCYLLLIASREAEAKCSRGTKMVTEPIMQVTSEVVQKQNDEKGRQKRRGAVRKVGG